MAPHDLSFQPENLIPTVVFSPEKGILTAEDKKKLGNSVSIPPRDNLVLCRACGWTAYNECTSSYLPRLRVFHTRANSGLWVMGNDYVMWDRIRTPRTQNDYMTVKFLQERGTRHIPLVEEMYRFGKDDSEFQFTIMSRAKGVPLMTIWEDLSADIKKGYAQQMIAALRELRQFTSPVPCRVDGSTLWDNIIGQCSPGTCKTIEKTKEEWFSGMAAELRYGLSKRLQTEDKNIIDAALQDIIDKFPDNAPYVLTHGDLNMGNIIVNEGKIEAIIDWELAGYYPWWVERWASRQRAGNGSFELFDMVWPELNPDLDNDQFRAKVSVRVGAAIEAWGSCDIAHTESHDVWMRPPFCECKPYAGLISRRFWGAELRHTIGKQNKAWDRNTLEEATEEAKLYTRLNEPKAGS
jgi:hypothetical protein